jgi:hypothetical protein
MYASANMGHPSRDEGFVVGCNFGVADEPRLAGGWGGVSKNFYLELLSSTLYFFAAVSIRFQAARRSASVTPST